MLSRALLDKAVGIIGAVFTMIHDRRLSRVSCCPAIAFLAERSRRTARKAGGAASW